MAARPPAYTCYTSLERRPAVYVCALRRIRETYAQCSNRTPRKYVCCRLRSILTVPRCSRTRRGVIIAICYRNKRANRVAWYTMEPGMEAVTTVAGVSSGVMVLRPVVREVRSRQYWL